MFRKLIQATLCIILCPLLAAQEVAVQVPSQSEPSAPAPQSNPLPAPIIIPKQITIKVVALDNAALAASKTGDTIKLKTAIDLIENGHMILRAGTPLTSTILRIRDHGRRGKLFDMELGEPFQGRQAKICLASAAIYQDPSPGYFWRGPSQRSQTIFAVVIAVMVAVVLFGKER